MANIFIKAKRTWFFHARVTRETAPRIARQLAKVRQRYITIIYDNGQQRIFNTIGREVTNRNRNRRKTRR